MPRTFPAALKTPDLNLFLFKMEKFPSVVGAAAATVSSKTRNLVLSLCGEMNAWGSEFAENKREKEKER